MNSALIRIRTGFSVLVTIVIGSVLGYHFLGKYTWVESVWMTVITLSSVGYGERPASDSSPVLLLFTCVVIVLGMTAVGYTFGGFLQMLAHGEIDEALGIHRLNKEISKLKDHVIICGYGRIGQILASNLKKDHFPFVIVERDADAQAEARAQGYLCMSGDATSDDVLLRAGIKRARTVVCGLPEDTSNVFITLTCRGLNPEIQIIARAESQSSESKMLQAGADRTVMPAIIGAHQMARMITRPSTADLVHLLSQQEEISVEMDEYRIGEKCQLIGVSIRESRARSFNLLIIAVTKANREMIFNPDAEYKFEALDTVILMGPRAKIASFVAEYHF